MDHADDAAPNHQHELEPTGREAYLPWGICT